MTKDKTHEYHWEDGLCEMFRPSALRSRQVYMFQLIMQHIDERSAVHFQVDLDFQPSQIRP